jgi:hypothetical protein
MNFKPLICSLRRIAAGLAFLVVCWPLVAAADCVDGVRNPTLAELEFHARAVAALVAALPPAPTGARLTGNSIDFNRLPAIGVLCRGQKEGDFTLEASRFYVVELGSDEIRRRRTERAALADELYALVALPPELKAQRDALEQKASAGYSATDAARKAGDLAGARAREAEAHGFSQQARDLQKKHEEAVKPQADELRRRQQALDGEGQNAAVRLAMNATRLPEAGLMVPSGSYGTASPARSAGLKVRNVVWSVGGLDTPLRQALAGAIDRERLQAMVGRPLPGAAESQAVAARAAPVSVANQPPPVSVATRPPPAPAAQGPATVSPAGGGAAPAPVVNSPDGGAKQALDGFNAVRGLFGR